MLFKSRLAFFRVSNVTMSPAILPQIARVHGPPGQHLGAPHIVSDATTSTAATLSHRSGHLYFIYFPLFLAAA
jgi:hypothetical protein